MFKIHPPEKDKLVKSLFSLLKEVKEFKGKLFVAKEREFEVVEF